jgi:phosphinothricin acetyltransferase
MSAKHSKAIIDIFNDYITISSSAFPDKPVPYEYFDKIAEVTKDYPAFSIKEKDRIIGFCFLHPYNPLPTFNECAEITYFIDKDFTGKGIGLLALERLETEAKKKEITTILASISSENNGSIAFHKKNGFTECGRFEKIAKKRGKQFDIVWMQKFLDLHKD